MQMKDFITFIIDIRTKGTYKLLSTSKNSGNIIYMSLFLWNLPENKFQTTKITKTWHTYWWWTLKNIATHRTNTK